MTTFLSNLFYEQIQTLWNELMKVQEYVTQSLIPDVNSISERLHKLFLCESTHYLHSSWCPDLIYAYAAVNEATYVTETVNVYNIGPKLE